MSQSPHPDAVYHLVNAATSGEAAWRTATTVGATDVEAVLNALWTLAFYASPAEAPCEPKRLLSIHDSATSSLSRLKTTLRRLRAIITAIERWLPDLSQLQPLLHSQTVTFVHALNLDLAEKSDVLKSIEQAIFNAQPVSTAAAVTLVARWSETVSLMTAPDAATIQALVEPLELMDRINNATPTNPSDQSTPTPLFHASPLSPKKTLSPALAMLTKPSPKR